MHMRGYTSRHRWTGVHIKILERYPVVRVRSLQDGLKHNEVIPRDESTLRRVGNAKQRRELRTTYFGQVSLGRDGIYELVGVEVPSVHSQ